MAVPQNRVTKSRRNMRRAHDSLTAANPAECPNCGEGVSCNVGSDCESGACHESLCCEPTTCEELGRECEAPSEAVRPLEAFAAGTCEIGGLAREGIGRGLVAFHDARESAALGDDDHLLFIVGDVGRDLGR